MEFLLSVALNHSVWAQASLQIPSGKLEGEQDDVYSTVVPVFQPCLATLPWVVVPLCPAASLVLSGLSHQLCLHH